MTPHECQKIKDLEGGRSKDMRSRIFNKVEVLDMKLKGIKEDVSPIQFRPKSW